MDEIITQLKNGYSNSELFLIKNKKNIFVRKVNNIDRNISRLKELSKLNLNLPTIYNITPNSYDMEYIPNLDMRSYILHHDINKLTEYIYGVITTLKSTTTYTIDFTDIYKEKLTKIDFDNNFIFDKETLLSKLPKSIPISEYHGDLTLDNILYSLKDTDFVLIDPIQTEYSSYIFDIAKLRQDLKCKWFVRNESNIYMNSKLAIIDHELSKFEYNDDYLLILMLLRILPYTKNNEDKNYLINEINNLWK